MLTHNKYFTANNKQSFTHNNLYAAYFSNPLILQLIMTFKNCKSILIYGMDGK